MSKSLKVPRNIAIYAYFGVLFFTLIMGGLLCMQYTYFMQEAQELMVVKESYNQYVEMLKRSLDASLSGNNSETEDEPGDFESSKKNELQQPELSVVSFNALEEENKSLQHEFDLISPEEDSRLHFIKQTVQKFKPSVSKVKKRTNRKSKRLSSYRYIPQLDFVFSWPIELPKFWLSSLYGPRRFSNGKVSFHHGIDMASVRGTPVKAAASGKVLCAQWVSGYGNCIDIYHNEHYKTRYAHLHSIKVRVGQLVEVGQVIATVGDTGFVRKSGKDASHLHFEIHYDGQSVNPLKYLFI